MDIDRITQFELGLMELNRNISYNEESKITENYNQLNEVYKEIVKSDVPIEEKNRLYNCIMEAHHSIEGMNDKKSKNIRKSIVIGTASIVSGIFLIKGPEVTGMAISGTSSILNPIARFAPAAILGTVLLFGFWKKNKK